MPVFLSAEAVVDVEGLVLRREHVLARLQLKVLGQERLLGRQRHRELCISLCKEEYKNIIMHSL